MSRVRILTVIEVELGNHSEEDVFNSFQESVEGGELVQSVTRATINDLYDFMPDEAAIKANSGNLLVSSIDVEV